MKGWVGSVPAVGLAEIELTVACLCASVEALASALSHETRTVLEIYTSLRWSFELETELDAASRWILQRTRLRPHEKNPISEADDLERLVSSTNNERMTRTLSSQRRRVLDATNNIRDVQAPLRFQLERVEEVEAETRYCAKGLPQPLRRNVLGERYAARDRPLAFLTRHSAATEVFRRMRPRVKLELRLRETRRIERLNAQRRKELQSPEDVLEAKFDQLFLAWSGAATEEQLMG